MTVVMLAAIFHHNSYRALLPMKTKIKTKSSLFILAELWVLKANLCCLPHQGLLELLSTTYTITLK